MGKESAWEVEGGGPSTSQAWKLCTAHCWPGKGGGRRYLQGGGAKGLAGQRPVPQQGPGTSVDCLGARRWPRSAHPWDS